MDVKCAQTPHVGHEELLSGVVYVQFPGDRGYYRSRSSHEIDKNLSSNLAIAMQNGQLTPPNPINIYSALNAFGDGAPMVVAFETVVSRKETN